MGRVSLPQRRHGVILTRMLEIGLAGANVPASSGRNRVALRRAEGATGKLPRGVGCPVV